ETGVGELVDRLAARVGDHQAGLGLFPIGNKEPVVGVLQQLRRESRLLADAITALLQARLKIGNQAVTETLVEGACFWKTDCLARTLAELVFQTARVVTDPL